MRKAFAVESVDTLGEAGSGKFTALVSVFGNIDHVKDVVMPNAFDRAVKEQDPPPIVWSHYWDIPPIGNTIDWGPTDKGLQISGELFVGEGDKHQYADMVYAAMRKRDGRKPALREFSFSYQIPDGGQQKGEREIEGKTIEVQELHELFPIAEVGPTLKGCNPDTELVSAPKRLTSEDIEMLRRMEAFAKGQAIGLSALIEMLEEHGSVEGLRAAIREGAYPPEVAELLLTYQDH